jgi:DNA-binding transcriptional MerR regulator
LTTRDAAMHCQVRPVTIRAWVARGHLRAADHTAQGHPLYRLLDVARAEAATRTAARRVLTA